MRQKPIAVSAFAILAVTIASAQEHSTLSAYVIHNSQFSTLSRYLHRDGLENMLDTPNVGRKGYTLLAPTDTAFANLPPAVIAEFQKRPDLLAATLRYHVVTDRESLDALTSNPPTLEGDTLNLTTGVPARTARILRSDVALGNGNLDVIDQVLLPPSVVTALQRDGALPIAVNVKSGHGKRNGKGVVTGVNGLFPTATTRRKTKVTHRVHHSHPLIVFTPPPP
jgi:uncharacterized surface protein with fasciclin (FAS1) repeats